MKTPIYRAGQTVQVPSRLLCTNEGNGMSSPGRILYPVEDGTYLVRLRDGGYVKAGETEISACREYDPMEPAPRNGIRIVFFGNGRFALPVLEMLVGRGYDVAAVVTAEDKPCGRGRALRRSAVKIYAESAGILVYQPHELGSDRFRRRIARLQPTLGVVVEFRMLPRSLYAIPKWGTVNLHSSLLPMYRGASTISSAIRDGETMTGVTTFMLEDSVDRGHVVNNLAVGIKDGDSAGDVHARLCAVGPEMMDDAIQRIAHSCSPVPQSELVCDFIRPCYAPKLNRMDLMVPWHRPADSVYDFIRAHSPAPAAWTPVSLLDGKNIEVKIFRTEKTDMPRGLRAPGEMFRQDRKLYIACSDRLLSILELQPPNRRRMTANEFLNGYRGACRGFCQFHLTINRTSE